MVPLKYLSSFCRPLKIPLINCLINFILTSSANCFMSNATPNQDKTFAITDMKRYVPVVALSTENNGKLFQQSKS